jgi:hypothetical protein
MSAEIIPYRDDPRKAARRAEVERRHDADVACALLTHALLDTAPSEYCAPESDGA